MKRKISLLLLIVMLICIIPSYAASGTITSEYYVNRSTVDDEWVYNIVINGVADVNTDIKMIAYKKDSPAVLSDSDIKAIDQSVTAADGSYTFSASLIEEGTYIFEISVNNMAAPHTFEFEIKEKSYYENIIELFVNSTGVQVTAGLIDEYFEEMLFNDKFYNAQTGSNIKTAVATGMYNNRNSMNIENAISIFDEAVILAYMKLNENYAKAEELLQTYEDLYIHLKDTDGALNIYKTCYEDYPEIKESVISSLMLKEYASVSDIRTAFREAVIVKATTMLDISDLSLVVENNSDYLGVSYSSLEDTAKSTVLTHILENKSLISSKADFLKYYNEGCDMLSTGGNTGTPSAGGGGGGGGGAVVPGVEVDPSLVDVPEPEIYEAPRMFEDLDSVPWAYDSIKYLYDNGIVSGKSNGYFYPNDYVKREEFAKMLAGALELTEESYSVDFSDVPENAWFYTPISRLNKYELVKGFGNGSFGVGRNITREDMATMIYRAITILYLGDKIENTESSKEFSDIDTVSSYARNSVIMLSNMDIIKGVGDNLFAPKKNATRAETAVIIHRVMNLKERNAL